MIPAIRQPGQASKSIRETVLCALLYVVVYGAQQLCQWPFVRIWGANAWGAPIGADLTAVLNSATCYKESHTMHNVSQLASDCKYIYGDSLISVINFLGLTARDTEMISWLFILATATIFGLLTVTVLRLGGIIGAVALATVAISPPLMLLLERGNFDALVFGLVFFSLILLAGRWPLVGITGLVLATLFKFYTGPLALAAAIYPKKNSTRVIALIMTVTSSVLLVRELTSKSISFPMEVGAAFGAPTIGLYINLAFSNWGEEAPLTGSLPLVLGMLMTFSLGAAVWFLLRRNASFRMLLRRDTKNMSVFEILGYGSGLVFAACYFAGESFDYRLVFLVPYVAVLLSRARDQRRSQVVIASISVAAFWLSYNARVGQVLGDILISAFAALALIQAFTLLKSSLIGRKNAHTQRS